MTHQRTRGTEDLIAKTLSYAPCVGVLGMRQVGKTTLLKKFASTYRTFDEDAFLRGFDGEKTALLEHSPGPVGLDEIQKHPPVFDALKLSIDNKKRMGRFLVSGSVRFASRKQVRESLTGRIVTLEVFPMGLAECHGKKTSLILRRAHSNAFAPLLKNAKQAAWATPAQREHYATSGGLPGICFRRDAAVRGELHEQHLDTLLRRDIHLVRQMRLSYQQLRDLMTALAGIEGLPANLSHLSRQTGCSMPTIKSTLQALEGLFLVRPYGKTWFIEDAGLAHHLRGGGMTNTRMTMIREVYRELRLQHSLYVRHDAVMRPYLTRGGIDVPFLFDFKDGVKLAILIDAGEWPSEKSLKSLTWMRKRFEKLRALILTSGTEGLAISRDCITMPIGWIY